MNGASESTTPGAGEAVIAVRITERYGPVHGDYRLDNLMFAPDGSDVAAVDWQTISLGLPARDLAFLCSTGLDADVRRSCEESVLRAYHQALVTQGVDDYRLDECRDDYAYAMFQGLLIVVLGWTVADKTERGDAMFLTPDRSRRRRGVNHPVRRRQQQCAARHRPDQRSSRGGNWARPR